MYFCLENKILILKMTGKKSDEGYHICGDFYGCNPKMLDDSRFIRDTLLQAVEKSGMQLIGMKIHRFKPQGITGYVLLATSHIAIHTWSELKYASVDIYSCGSKEGVFNAFTFIMSRLQPKGMKIKSFLRPMSDTAIYHPQFKM